MKFGSCGRKCILFVLAEAIRNSNAFTNANANPEPYYGCSLLPSRPLNANDNKKADPLEDNKHPNLNANKGLSQATD